MDNYEEYIHQLHENLKLFLRLIDEKPEFLKKVLRDINTNRIQFQQKWKHSEIKISAKSSSDKTKRPNVEKFKKIPIEEAINVLDHNIADIKSVEQWNETMGYSSSYFWRKFVAYFHTAPQVVFIRRKKSALIGFIKANKNCTCTEAAQHIHLRDGNGLYQFVKLHFGCTPTELMRRVWNQEEI